MGQIALQIDKPYPKQIEFMMSRCRYTAYGGARGGGKSWTARLKAVLLCLTYPRYTSVAFKTYINRTKREPCDTFKKDAKD